LDETYNLKSDSRIYFAGQITGVEGYIESTASGFTAGINMAAKLSGKPPVIYGNSTCLQVER
jgi:methylenetetrahydrofolate--tRNA-(uracil-5-)-methyltransferase